MRLSRMPFRIGRTRWLRGVSILALFAAQEPGVWYDTSDISTMYADAAGTTPATVDQPVGLLLDKRLGLVRGAELKATGIPALVGAATAATYDTATGVGTATRTNVSNQSYVAFTGLTVGATYLIEIANTGSANFSVRANFTANAILVISPGQTRTVHVAMVGSALGVVPDNDGTSIAFTVSSLKLLPGNHATQATTSAKPILRQHYTTKAGALELLSNGTFDSGTTGWVANGASTISATSGVFRVTNTATGSASAFITITTVPGTAYTVSALIGAFSGATADFRVGTTAEGSTNFRNNNQPSGSTINGSFVATATTTYISLVSFNSGGVAGTYVEWDNISVKEATADGYYLEFDGVDDFLRSTFTIAQPWDRISALRQISWTAGDRILSGGTFNGDLYQHTASPEIVLHSGTVNAVNTGLPVGVNAVTQERHNGASSALRVNTAVAVAGNVGVDAPGGITVAARYVGANTNAGNIRFYGTVMREGTLTDDQITSIRTLQASKASITL